MEEEAADPAVVAELQREVEDLKLRLHMAAEHYKDKYKECQRLQKQVQRLSEQQGVGLARQARGTAAGLQAGSVAHNGLQSRWMESLGHCISGGRAGCPMTGRLVVQTPLQTDLAICSVCPLQGSCGRRRRSWGCLHYCSSK